MNSAYIGPDRRRSLGASGLHEQEARLHVGQITLAQLPDRQGPVVELLLFGRIAAALCDPAEFDLRLLPCGLRRPDAVKADRVAA